MKVRVQLVQNNPLHRVPSIFINIYSTQFIFNVIPTLLRHRQKHKINLYNSCHIFFTKNSIQAFGGLANYLLFRSAVENSDSMATNKIYLYGNNWLIAYLQKLRFKLGYKSLRISYTNWVKSKFRLGIFSSDLFNRIRVNPQLPNIFVNMQDYLVKNCNKQDYFDSRYYISKVKTKYINTDCSYFHTNLIDIYPIITNVDGTTFTHYLCILPQQRKGIDLNLEKFTHQTGINKQKLIKEFFGKGFIQKDGKNYKKQEFLFDENFKPSNILIFHYTNVTSIQQLLKSNILSNYFQNKNQTGLVVHIVEDLTVLSTDIFKSFISKFEKNTKHLWYNKQLYKINQKQYNFLQENIQQHLIWAKVFPTIIKNIYLQRMKFYSTIPLISITSLFPSLTSYMYKRVYNYVKNQYLGDKYEERLETQPKNSYIYLLQKGIQNGNQKLLQLQQSLQIKSVSSPKFQPKVIFLGTSSSMPTASRNTSGILVSLNQNNTFLLDCGEQTFQQLVNHFSPSQYEEQLLKLKVIFITHIHSDHNLGILNLISQRQKIMKQKGLSSKLFLIIPFNVFNYYSQYNEIIEDLSPSCDVLFTQVLLNQSYQEQTNKQLDRQNDRKKRKFSCSMYNSDDSFFSELQTSAKTKQLVSKELPHQKDRLNSFKIFLKDNNYKQFLPIRVIHCPQSFGIIISNNQFKVSYSGDTRPSPPFKQAASHSDIMIHEATFNDQQSAKASAYQHSTVQQAVKIGVESHSKSLALTHFNFKFSIPSKLKRLTQYQDYFLKNTIFSFDHLQIPLKANPLLPQISKLISMVSQQARKTYKSQKQVADKNKIDNEQ